MADQPQPQFSIVTPVYAPPLDVLADTIASVRSQEHDDWEWVLVDDASPDAAVRQVIATAGEEDSRIRLVAREGSAVGQGDADGGKGRVGERRRLESSGKGKHRRPLAGVLGTDECPVCDQAEGPVAEHSGCREEGRSDLLSAHRLDRMTPQGQDGRRRHEVSPRTGAHGRHGLRTRILI